VVSFDETTGSATVEGRSKLHASDERRALEQPTKLAALRESGALTEDEVSGGTPSHSRKLRERG